MMTPNDANPDSVPLPELSKGSLFAGKYRIDRLLGEGGMGCVWAATNLALDTPVAIKVLHAEMKSEETEDRMLWEARSAAKLKHPAITRVFDFGRTEEGRTFLAMELLEGRSLGDLLVEQTLPPETAIQLVLPVAGALVAAHEQGIVHRDLKPDNIFLSEDASGTVQPKILDFGIAKVDRGVDKRTINGEVLGSPEYMSPEQARGLPSVDARSDVWALAVVIYELVTGRVPFTGGNYNAVMCAIIEQEPPHIQQHGVNDDKLWQLLTRALRKDPERRYASMKEFGAALAQWLWDRGVREDACCKALDADWLDGSRMGVRLLSGKTRRVTANAEGQVLDPTEGIAPVPPAAPAVSRTSRRLGWVAGIAVLVGLLLSLDAWAPPVDERALLAPSPSTESPSEPYVEDVGEVRSNEPIKSEGPSDSLRTEVEQVSAALQSTAEEDPILDPASAAEELDLVNREGSDGESPTTIPETSANPQGSPLPRPKAATPKVNERAPKRRRASEDSPRKARPTRKRGRTASHPAPHERDLKTPW